MEETDQFRSGLEDASKVLKAKKQEIILRLSEYDKALANDVSYVFDMALRIYDSQIQLLSFLDTIHYQLVINKNPTNTMNPIG